MTTSDWALIHGSLQFGLPPPFAGRRPGSSLFLFIDYHAHVCAAGSGEYRSSDVSVRRGVDSHLRSVENSCKGGLKWLKWRLGWLDRACNWSCVFRVVPSSTSAPSPCSCPSLLAIDIRYNHHHGKKNSCVSATPPSLLEASIQHRLLSSLLLIIHTLHFSPSSL